ncbi:ABC transporter substrate-binding protein [Cellulomonas hominis]
MTSPLRVTAAAFGLGLALVLTACGGGGGPAAGPAADGTSSADGEGGTLVVGMTASNIPGLDTVQAQSEGGEGTRFAGLQLYDGLTRWDLSQGESAPELVPGLAESWEVGDDGITWTFHLRSGVTFHDGTPWDADAAIYNFDRFTNEDSPLYSAELNSMGGLSLSGIDTATKVDDMTIQIVTNGPWSYLDEDLASVPFGSPTAIEAEGDDFAANPVGTGPFKFESLTRGQELVLVRNDDYYLGAPKLDRLILRPIPEATARLAALRSGEVNWIEVPSPDDVASLTSEGFQVLTNSYPHNWPWLFDTTQKPWDDPRVRQAANFAIDRESLATGILQGTGQPAYQYLGEADFGFDPADDYYSYDPDRAKELLAEAGYPDGFSTTLSYPTSGSGNMVPTPMNESLQRDLAAVGIDVELEPVEWASMLTDFYAGKIPGGAGAINISLGFSSPALVALVFGTDAPFNVGGYSNPEIDALLAKTKTQYSREERGETLAEMNRILVEDAPWLVVVHDLNPRVLAANVHGFVMPKSWYVDLTSVWVDE